MGCDRFSDAGVRINSNGSEDGVTDRCLRGCGCQELGSWDGRKWDVSVPDISRRWCVLGAIAADEAVIWVHTSCGNNIVRIGDITWSEVESLNCVGHCEL